LRLYISSNEGSYEDGFTVATGADVATASVVLADAFDALATTMCRRNAVEHRLHRPAPGRQPARRRRRDRRARRDHSPLHAQRALHRPHGGGNKQTLSFVAPSRSISPPSIAPRSASATGCARSRATWSTATASQSRLDRRRRELPGTALHQSRLHLGMDSSSWPDKRWHDILLDLGYARLLKPALVLRFTARVNSDEPPTPSTSTTCGSRPRPCSVSPAASRPPSRRAASRRCAWNLVATRLPGSGHGLRCL